MICTFPNKQKNKKVTQQIGTKTIDLYECLKMQNENKIMRSCIQALSTLI